MKQTKADVSMRHKGTMLLRGYCLKTSFHVLQGLSLLQELVELQKIVPSVLQVQV